MRDGLGHTLLGLIVVTLALNGPVCNEYDLAGDDDTDPGGVGGLDDDDDDNGGPGDDDDDDADASDDDDNPGDDDTDGFDDDTYGDTPVGRVLTILLTLNDMYMDQSVSQQLLVNSVAWVTPTGIPAPRVLIIRDDDHSGEHPEDSEQIRDNLLSAGYDAVLIEEPQDGIDSSHLSGYSVAILSNPGHSPDDVSTLEALYDFSCHGFGLIFQGDDMARFDDEGAFDMSSLTRLEFIDNGTTYAGHGIDNDEGDRYAVTLANISHPVVAGIEGVTFFYGDDIDTTEPAHTNETVLAWATVEGMNSPSKPAIAGYSN